MKHSSFRLLAQFAFLLCALASPVGVSAQVLHRDTTKPVELSDHRQLFLDDVLLESRHGLTRVVHQPVKLPAPIVVGDQPWENWAEMPTGEARAQSKNAS